MRKIIGLVLMTVVGCQWVRAQITVSPYTIVGLGDWSDRSMSHHSGMGGVGIGTPSAWHINGLNPALLPSNGYSVFELALQGENREMSNNLGSQRNTSAGYGYLKLAFPIKPGVWTTSLSLNPRTAINYNFTSTVDIQNSDDESFIDFEGQGGLSEVSFSNGVRVTKSISLGVTASYLFGFSDHKNTTFLIGDFIDQFPLSVEQRTNYDGFNFGFGAAYSKKLSNSENFLNVGVIYEMSKELKGRRVTQFSSETLTGIVILGDTLSELSTSSHFSTPSKLGVGASFIKSNQLTLGIDLTISNWEEDAGFGSDNDEYRSVISAAIGMEFIPDYDDVDNYLKRVRYRIGAKYEQLPYVLSGENIDDFGINFGWSLPVRAGSFLNMAFKIGQRGTDSSDLVKEQYFKFIVGATMNDRWFIRRRYN